MENYQFKKSLYGGIFIVVFYAPEIIPLISNKFEHISEPHILENNIYISEPNSMIMVNGTSAVITRNMFVL